MPVRYFMNVLNPHRGGQSKGEHGFSLTELVVAVAVALVLMGIGMPAFLRAYHTYLLSNAASQTADILRFTRYEAIRRNMSLNCQIQPYAGDPTMTILWADSNKDGNPDPTEQQVLLGNGGNLISGAGVPGVACVDCGGEHHRGIVLGPAWWNTNHFRCAGSGQSANRKYVVPGKRERSGGWIPGGGADAGRVHRAMDRRRKRKLATTALRNKRMRREFTNRGRARRSQSGFTLMELLVATVIILVGLVAVAQLVPTSVLMNTNNRNDGTALVFAQHQTGSDAGNTLEVQHTFSDPLGVICPLGNTCQLGDPAQPGTLVGSPVNVGSGSPIMDFSAAPVNGYSFTFLDPHDPYGAAYDVRWAVITSANGPITTGKRIILGVYRRGMQSTALPVTLDTMVFK